MKWFTSDLHFGHRNIVKFTNREVEIMQDNVAKHHDEWLIDLWNSQVKAGDLVYHLGDFCFAKGYDSVRDVVKNLNGQKIFIKGNHDREDHLRRLKIEGYIQKTSDYEEIKIKGNATVLFHFPIASWHKQARGSWHLHGHCHGNLKQQHINGKMLDVGLDQSFNMYGTHRFFSEDDIETYMNSRDKYISDNHREYRE